MAFIKFATYLEGSNQKLYRAEIIVGGTFKELFREVPYIEGTD